MRLTKLTAIAVVLAGVNFCAYAQTKPVAQCESGISDRVRSERRSDYHVSLCEFEYYAN